MSQSNSRLGDRAGFTLVEMLVAMAITLVMMAAVVTLFANVSSSVSKRRASLEMNGQIRQVRNQLQEDLAHATCPGVTWQRPEWAHGYIELIEGPYREGNASNLIDYDPANNKNLPSATNPEIDHGGSILPSSNMPFTTPTGQSGWATDGGGLGDYDDILMLTVRNEQKPFVGRMPSAVLNGTKALSFDRWGVENFESQLAEVVWFAIENPGFEGDPLAAATPDPTVNHFFGEPGMRTIYRRTLLIAPWLNPYSRPGANPDAFTHDGQTLKAVPGLLRVLPAKIAVEDAIAAMVAFQDRYDLSARLEWDGNANRWKIMANTLGDLTKRENRFDHFGFLPGNGTSNPSKRIFPFALESIGSYSGTSADVKFVDDPEVVAAGSEAKATANMANSAVASYSIDAPTNYTDISRRYKARPFAYVNKDTTVPATAQAMLNDDGAVIRVLHGPVPLWGERRGEDVMMSDALAFDVRVFDPGAPIFATAKKPYDATVGLQLDVMLLPTDPGWTVAYNNVTDNGGGTTIGKGNANANSVTFPYASQGAYVDMGYGYGLAGPLYTATFSSAAQPWFFTAQALHDVFGKQLAPGFAVYDTWSFHYENDGLNEDGDEIEAGKWQIDNHNGTGTPLVDEGTNGVDDYGHYYNPVTGKIDTDIRLGVDDVGERETTPPYDKPLRGIQVLIRAYERDSRTIRQVRVNQHFMPE